MNRKKTRNAFGATAPPFIDYLKDILRRYPDGGQILKELIQNADDAEASEVIFIHDERSYGTETLWTDDLGKYQGPALYAYNNAVFAAEDWEGIQNTGRSVKRNDPNKVGRFGIGFNSVYHITDVPCIFSAGHIALLDPQEQLLGKESGGIRWSLFDTEDQETLMTLRDQFHPLQDIIPLVSKQTWENIITGDQLFHGTLFRFPLRNEASEISDNVYDTNRVAQLFDSFLSDADLSPLFLRNVTSVSLIHVKPDNSVNIKVQVTCSQGTDVVLESDDLAVQGSTSFKYISFSSEDRKETKKWLITSCCMKEGHIAKLDTLAKKLCFRPQVDLAFLCGQQRHSTDSRLSCFLPLPNNESNKTGLPVYVNACFGLTDNRRHIKWQEEDQKYDEAAQWNELLVKDVLPHAYLRILQDAVKLSKDEGLPASAVYDLWPDISQMQHKDKWHEIALDVLQRLFRQNVAVLSLAADERKFVTLSEALLPCNHSTSTEIVAAIKRILVSYGENLVTLPDSVARAIKDAYQHHIPLRHVTPSFLRAVLHRNGLHHISKEDKLLLLEYILSDGQYRELQGLQLLPLSDGTFRSFTDKEEDIAFIDSNEFPRVLLPGCKDLFIPSDLSTPTLTHLKDLATKHLFKITNINANDVAEYTKRYLPNDWKQTKANHVTWEIGNSQHPPSGWLQEFWKFLNTHFRDLSCFNGMPLIPIKPQNDVKHTVQLARLQQNSTLIFQKNKQTSLPDQIVQIVKTVGGTVVRGDDWLKHDDLDTYVLNPSPRSVMRLFVNLDCQHVFNEIKTVPLKHREELKDYLSGLDSLSVTEKNVLSKFPLFQTMDGRCVAVQSKKAVLLSSSPKIPTDLPMPDTVVQCATEADRRLLLLLNIVLLDTAEATGLLIDGIERRDFGKENVVKIMTWILKHGNILFSQNDALKKRLKELNFIEMNGELKRTSSFFDPRIEEFNVLFGSDFFPPSVYTETSHMLESLIDLGLLSKMTDVTPIHLLYAATQIDKLLPHFENEAVKRSEVLVKLLNTNDLLANFSKEQIECLTVLQWFPCVKPGDESKLNKDKGKGLFCPNEVRHLMYKDIVGHVMPLTGELNENVGTKLGLKRVPPPEKVKENMSVLRSLVQIMKTPDTDANFKMKLHSIYRHMQDNISAFKKVTMNDACWLWTHNQFVSPQDLVLDYPPSLDLSSYIGKIPEEFLPYKSLFSEFGLRPWLSDKEIMGILNDIKQSIDERKEKFASSSELNVSVAILNWMWREKKIVSDDIPMPVRAEADRFTLKPLSTTVFCDISREGLESLNNDEEEFHVIHEEIPRATAEWLKVPLLSTRILSPEQVGIEQCGQHEPITTRIKNILNEYDEENDIFKELIQNAEDARAKDCKFMVDFRVHNAPPESLIDPGMSLCQGPCLWAFNNELFTEDDWGNIVRVGAASKANMVEKIGMFGLGFNTVYHVTDVPSILSGNHLLILDPNVNHLKKHIKSKTNPGIKLDLSKQGLLHWFSGQFRPYERIFYCNFSKENTTNPYPGTLIKLPFRTREEALTSEICAKVYDKHSIDTFQQHLANNSQTHLLFLKNVSTISLQNIADNAPTPPTDDHIKTIFTVSKKVLEKKAIPDETHTLKQRDAENKLMKLDKHFKEVIDCSTVSIAEITQHCDGSNVQAWLLYNCFGTEQSLQMALEDDKKAKFSLPVGGIAVPLHNDPKTKKWVTSQTDLVGQAFCFLPLSIHTGLPVNINGAFAVTSNRKGLWETGVKHQWNQALLKDPTATAYVTVLLTLKSMAENEELESYCYHTFWPDREKVSDTFKPLVDALYFAICQYSSRPLELFSDGIHWCSIDKAIFLHQSIEEDKKIGMLAMKVCQSYVNHVVPLPLWARNSFRDAGLEKALQSRMCNWETFYNGVVFSNLSTMDPESRNALVLHAIDLNSEPIDNLLKFYPCIPTQSGQLQYIKKLVNPSGKVACLFDKNEGRLLGGTESDFCSPKRIQRLLDLGMLNHKLPLEDILDRADNITSVWSKDKSKAYGHLRCILEVLRSSHKEEGSPYWALLKNTTFIPAFPPNSEKDQMVQLWKPVDVFSDQCRYLVSMIHPVVDCSNLNLHSADPVLKILGIHQSYDLRPETVLQQLQEACKETESFNNSKSTLHKIAYECYTFLDQWLYYLEDSKLISKTAHSFPFILVGDKFEHVKSVAKNAEFEAKPYLHVLPTVFKGFTKLWECVGVEKKFTVDQCLTVLKTLHTLHGSNPLPKSDLIICLTILNRGLYEAKEKILSDCLIPNERNVLQPASKLYFNDSPWMPDTATVTLCHENIPRVIAQYFGIKTTRHQTLQDHLVENISPFAFQFEQREQLTVRIKNIISAYPAKKDILKELIQNADDAEATEIHFVWDKRQHGTKKTFGRKWNQLQGPALCVYNNKVFSDADLKGIQQLGEGGKHDIQGKTGKYGLGFNSVYHLTDCPSIMTGDKLLCISDPNQKYIEGSSGKPSAGCGYKLEKVFKEMYDDVYKTFLPENFALGDGTMFRLPLRTGVMANDSKISNQGVTNQDMIELSKALSEDPEGLILFLKNIRKIQFHEINEHSQDLRTTFTVEKHFSENSNEERCSFQKHLCTALQTDKPATPCKAIYDVSISASDKRMSKWIIAEQFGSIKSIIWKERKLSDIIPQAALAACVHPKPVRMGDFNGGVFCSLPLPRKTGLPIHVNGNFEVDSSRRDLWKADGQSLKTNWNESLKQDVIAPLYAELIHCLRGSITEVKVCPATDEVSWTVLDSSYLCFFPTVSKDIAQDWHAVVQEVYRSINEKALDVIPVVRSSLKNIAHRPVTEITFDWCTVRKTELTNGLHLMNPRSTNMNPILEDLGMKLVPFTTKMSEIWGSFKTAGIELYAVSPSTVRNFLKEKNFNDSNQTERGLPLPTLIRNANRCSTLLQFCLKDINKDNCSSINGLPLLLTKDKVLREFNRTSPKLMSRYDGLFSEYEADFAYYPINMAHQEILQHGGFLHNLTIPMSVKYVKPLLQRFLQDCAVDPSSNLHVPNEAILKWLKELWQFFTSQLTSTSSQDWGTKTHGTLSSVKELFCDCCIIPVVCPRLNNRPFLQTLKDMACVIHSGTEGDISSVLFKLGYTKLNWSFYTEMSTQIHSLLYPELMNTNDANAVLDEVYKLNHCEFPHLPDKELRKLQCFLQSGISMSKNKQDYQRKLTSLPFFETIHGERVPLDNLGQVFILNMTLISVEELPALFMQHHRNTVFLKYNLENEQLSYQLNIQILSDLDFFMKFILPVLHKLTERQIIHCFKMLLSVQHDHKFKDHEGKIISSMKDVKLIQSAHGNLEKASHYFDKSVEMYKMMLPQDKFVPQSFWNEFNEAQQLQVKALLKALGMKYVVSKVEIIAFAYQIEREAKGQFELKELTQKSLKLLKTALTQESKNEEQKKKNQELMEKIADIKFIFPKATSKELCAYHQPLASEKIAVAIRGSLIESDEVIRDQRLIWTSMPIIPGYWSKKEKMQMVTHGALERPPGPCVTTNISNICHVPCQTNDLIKTRAEVFRLSYAHLQTNTFDSHSLTGLPVVLVENDTKLVKTEETSLGLQSDLEFRPYLYKIPGKDVLYAEFFKKIGVNEEPTALQYCNVLEAIYMESCDKKTLNANQLITIKHAVKRLFQLIKTQGSQSALKLPKVLHLPSKDGRLYPSNMLYFNDTVFEANRLEKALENKIHLLEHLNITDQCHLVSDIYEQHQLLQLLLKDNQPKMLSRYTEEKVVDSDMLLCEYGASCDFSGWFEKHLSSIHFRHGLICLIRAQSSGKITQEGATYMCQQMFGSIQMVCCKSLETELWFDQQPLNDTKSETEVNVKKGEEVCIFYLKHSDSMAVKVINKVNLTLTKEINALLDNSIPSVHLTVLGQLLMCDSLEEVQKILAVNGIHDSAETQNLLFCPPTPGTGIPEEWKDSLDQSFINNFEEGEYVGYNDSASDEEYMYAVIVEKLPERAGQLYSHRYKIQIGKDEVIEVGSLDLYQFKREKKPKQERKPTCMELIKSSVQVHSVSHTSQASSTSYSYTRLVPTTLEEAKKEIDECLTEIWTLSEEDRQKAIKRLYLRWHPDKNPDYEELATEAFRYLQNRIDELMTGKSSNSSHPRQNTNSRHPHPRQNTNDRDSHPRWNTNFRDFYEEWDQEARRHRRGRERFNRDYHYSYNFWTHHGNVPRPNREEAQRWYRQARCDLTAAHNDTSRGSTEWCLFKVHQAVEKALIAAEYKRTGQQVNNCSITQLAERISLYRSQFINLPQVVEELQLLGVDAKKTQYPSCHPPPLIPNGQFKPENETRALELASEILSQIEAYVN